MKTFGAILAGLGIGGLALFTIVTLVLIVTERKKPLKDRARWNRVMFVEGISLGLFAIGFLMNK